MPTTRTLSSRSQACVVYHRICNDKGAATFKELVGNYEGTIVCDALSTHAAGAWIGKLYEFDERAGDDLNARVELRRAESANVLELIAPSGAAFAASTRYRAGSTPCSFAVSSRL